MDVSKFSDKFNKLENNVYVVEEEVSLIDGLYESELKHDNVNLKTLNVYTGSKLTGDKVESYVLSTPSLMPWKNIIKIIGNIGAVYISYETQGDTIEADDINKVQNELIKTQTEINRYETFNDDKLNNIYTNDKVFTKEEVLQKIEDLIGTAPQVLDTFSEIATALGNDPNFATTIITLLAEKATAGNVYSKEEINNKFTGIGSGDMIKSVYDTDNDGIVDKAKIVVGPINWNNLKGV